MSSSAPADGSEDVSDFLRRIQKMREDEIEEDTERSRKLEEDILERRRQREARATERARSLSPDKSSPVNNPHALRSPRTFAKPDLGPPSDVLSDSKYSAPKEPLAELGKGQDHVQPLESPRQVGNTLPERSPSPSKSLPSTAGALSRTGTLSWQQRPASLRGPRSRPLSIVDRTPPSTSPTRSSNLAQIQDDTAATRSQISQNLAAKDPAWFRQTADRGIGSPAYRKTSGETPTPNGSSGGRRALHGLSREATPDSSEKPNIVSSASPKNLEKSFGSEPLEAEGQEGSMAGEKLPEGRRPLPSTPFQRFATTTTTNPAGTPEEEIDRDQFDTRPVQARFERPPSPTKGMGGFVQSAMLKRSESISKRWSAQPSATLSRKHSNASATEGAGITSSSNMPQLAKGNSNQPNSRTGSTHDESAADGQDPLAGAEERRHVRSQSTVSLRDRSPTKTGDSQTPSSPSKRWSPVKSSWLESALSKPESPNPTSVATLNQPSWMAELSKANAQRASRDENKSNDSAAKDVPPPVKPKTFALERETRKDAPVQDVSQKAKPSAPEPRIKEELHADLPSELTHLEQHPQSRSPPVSKPSDAALPTASAKDDTSVSTSDIKSVASPKQSISKAKPDAPPKKDFRTSLKARPTSSDQGGTDQPEFLNAFGKLKRTQTQNYVAPDELKHNILRGKAGLSLTGGPQKTVRRDELKEDLLKQKDVMKTKAATTPPPVKKSSGSVVPEAIAKKKALGRTNSSGNILVSATTKDRPQHPDTPVGLQPTNTSRENQEPKSTSYVKESDATAVFNGQMEATKSAPMPTARSGSSKLVERFIPSLAVTLAKGSSQARSDTASAVSSAGGPLLRTRELKEDPAAGQLQHMTKARARGPKRRLPTATASTAVIESETESMQGSKSRSVSKPIVPLKARNVTPVQSSLSNGAPSVLESPPSPQTPKSTITSSVNREVAPLQVQGSSKPLSPPLPSKPSKPSGLRDSTSRHVAAAEPEQRNQRQEVSAAKFRSNVPRNDDANQRVSVKDVSALWGQRPEPATSKAKEQIQLPTAAKEEAQANTPTNESKASTTMSKPISDVTKISQSESKPIAGSSIPSTSSKDPIHRPLESKTTPKPKTKPDVLTLKRSPELSPNARASQATAIFSDFFDEPPVAPKTLEVDTDAIVNANRGKGPKIKTLRNSTSEITSDGKTTPVSPNQERVMYNHRMYVCTHIFEDGSGARQTEVYLWIGSKVSESAVTDVQLFAKRHAKDNGGKLIIVRQGKESPNFFEALGGILIARSSSSAPYMLCGRRHLGHLAFDEVPYKASSLCSGFPFIVVAGPEKVFLWKGLGCNTEELSTASLTSMEISPLMRPVDEGAEPTEFLNALPRDNRTVPISADHWKHKPNHDNYRARLFHVEWHERPVSRHNTGPATALWGLVRRQSQPPPTHLMINEIVPFTQEDIQAENIYVLDAFFEIYILLNPLTQRKAASFANALVFAQEYSVLAVSADSRPCVPACTVVLEGAPGDMRACFRRWDDDGVDTSRLMAGKARGKGLRVMSLGEALVGCRA